MHNPTAPISIDDHEVPGPAGAAEALLEPARIDPASVARVLTGIAEIASETLELQDVIARVANSIRELIPFDNLGVIRLVDGDHAVIHASTIPCARGTVSCTDPIPLTAWSPRMRPRHGTNARIGDLAAEGDPTFPVDDQAIRGGVRSGMWEPFRSQDAFRGGVWLAAHEPHVFTREHQEALQPIAAILGAAVEHWRIWDLERRRRDRLDRVETLLGTLSESLDVTEIFERLSAEMQPILPHDMMTLTELEMHARTIRVKAWAGECDMEDPPGLVELTGDEVDRRVNFEIVPDIPAALAPDTERHRVLISLGMRSWLRVPVWLSGEVSGSLSFFHRDPARYDDEDAEVARRFADRIALLLSHHRLSEEARVAAEARERAERLQATVERLTRELQSRGRGRVIGVSRSWKDALLAVGRVASSETTVLITGESGTGKEVISNLIHQGSARSGRPFVAINCAALPEQLLESELFGHEKGSFTGAVATKVGRLEQAAGGTLFLDEIGEMSPTVQAKFLRVLEEREFQRLGGTRTLKADVRVIAATNRDLTLAIERGAFREDLFYRLNVFEIHVPPLRERTDDILPLAEAFLEDLGATMDRPAAGISRDAREWLLTYPWPGNVRELRNAIERAILLCDGGLITRAHLPTAAPRTAASRRDAAPLLSPGGMDLGAVERGYLEKALGQARGNKSKAAKLLGISRSQLYTRLERHGLR